jgi:GAF domain-containing protein
MSMYARQQATLAELTQSVPGSTDLSTIMQQAVTVVADTLAVAHSTIWQLQPGQRTGARVQRRLAGRCDAGYDG